MCAEEHCARAGLGSELGARSRCSTEVLLWLEVGWNEKLALVFQEDILGPFMAGGQVK